MRASAIPRTTIGAGTLLQHASRLSYRSTPFYFGADGLNRYDCPNKSYGVMYLANDLPTVLMESVFHKHRWHTGKPRLITQTELANRIVRLVGVHEGLVLADLTKPNVVASVLGLNLSQISSRRYGQTQRVSAEVHALNVVGTLPMDGLIYPSRNNPGADCIALFDRAAHKIRLAVDVDLARHAHWPNFLHDYQVLVAP